MPAPVLPIALGPDFSAGLQVLLRAAAQGVPAGALKEALDDPAVHTLVLALRPGDSPAAMLVGCLKAPDSLAQWLDLSCI